jgi:O-antigen ligase
LFVIALTKSRGGFVGLIAVIAYCVLKSNKKLVLSMLIGVLGVFLLIAAPAGYWEEMGTITGEAAKKDEHLESQWGTGAQRIYSWKLGWGMFKENPVMGVGQGNYPWHVTGQEEKMKVQWRTRSLGGRAAHSLYFTLLPELGLIGVTLFGLMVWYIWKDMAWVRKYIGKDIKKLSGDQKNIYYYTLAIEASIIGYLFSSIFISTLYYPNFWLMTAVMVALRNIVTNLNGSPVKTVKAEIHPPYETGRIPLGR